MRKVFASAYYETYLPKPVDHFELVPTYSNIKGTLSLQPELSYLTYDIVAVTHLGLAFDTVLLWMSHPMSKFIQGCMSQLPFDDS